MVTTLLLLLIAMPLSLVPGGINVIIPMSVSAAFGPFHSLLIAAAGARQDSTFALRLQPAPRRWTASACPTLGRR